MTSASATDLRGATELEPRFAAIYATHVDYVWTNLRRLGVPPAELDDAVQETFLVVFRRWGAMQSDASWRGWLFGIARRVAAHHRRGSGRRLRLVAAAEAEPERRNPALDDEVATRHAAALVEEFVDTLPPKLREVFILAEIEGQTGAEIAVSLDIKHNTVWSRLHASRQSFSRYLERLAARERGALDRGTLLAHAREGKAPEASRRRVMAALGVQLALPKSAVVGVAALKPILIALGLSITTLAGVAAVVRLAEPPREAHAAAPTSSERVDDRPAVVPEPPSSRAAATPELPVAESTAAPDLVEPPPSEPTTVATTRTPPATPRSSPSVPTSISREVELIDEVRRATASRDFDQALKLAKTHAREFPNGVLATERDLLRTGALCSLGRRDEAQPYIASLAPLPPDIAGACEEKPTNPDGAGQEEDHERVEN